MRTFPHTYPHYKCTHHAQDLEDGMDKKGGNADFEEKLAEALFAEEDDEKGLKDTLKTEDVVADAFTTEVRGRGGRDL